MERDFKSKLNQIKIINFVLFFSNFPNFPFTRTKQSLNYGRAETCMSRKKPLAYYTLTCKICFSKNLSDSVHRSDLIFRATKNSKSQLKSQISKMILN
jgi:hypothetical protein